MKTKHGTVKQIFSEKLNRADIKTTSQQVF